MRRLIVCLGVMALSAPAYALDPKPPVGIDPGLEPVAILTTGIDYTDPVIAKRLARDGEGEPIAWDFVDGDTRPFAASPNTTAANWGGDGTVFMRRLLAHSGMPRHSIIAVRINPADPASLARALLFVSQTRATQVAVPMWSQEAGDWEPLRLTAQRLPGLILSVPECVLPTPGVPQFPVHFGLATIKRLSREDRDLHGLDAALLAVCQGASGAAVEVAPPLAN